MSELPIPAVSRFVDVLQQRAQQQQTLAQQARQQLQRLQTQMQRLHQMGAQAQLKNSTHQVALHANAAGFRSGVWELAQQCRDAHGVQQLECARAQQHMLAATRHYGNMQQVLDKAQAQRAQILARKAQKGMDDAATQAWLRRQQHSRQSLQERTSRAA